MQNPTQPKWTVKPVDLSCYGDYTPPSLDSTIAYVDCFPKALCPGLCQRVDAGRIYESTVHDPAKGPTSEPYHRSSSGSIIDLPTYEWVKNRIEQVAILHISQRITVPFKEIRLAEALSFLVYDGDKEGRFRRHWDDAFHDGEGRFHYLSPQRKFTTITLLNDDYEGGYVELDTVLDPQGQHFKMKLQPGSMLIFPSDQRFPHEIAPTTKGRRRSVVAWFDVIR